MKYPLLALVLSATVFTGCRRDQEPPEVTASTRWRHIPEWQFIHGVDGGNDAIFDPHTSLYCSFSTDSTGKQHQFCVVMAPDSVMANAIQWDTAYIVLARIRGEQTMDSIQKADKPTH